MANRVLFSNYHVTINTNQPNNERTRRATAVAARAAVTHALRNIFKWARRVGDDGSIANFSRQQQREILRVRMRPALESGGAQNGGPHVHILLEIGHRSKVRVDYDKLVRIMKDGMMQGGFTRAKVNACHARVDLVPNGDVNNILHYIGKNGIDQMDLVRVRDAQHGATQQYKRPRIRESSYAAIHLERQPYAAAENI